MVAEICRLFCDFLTATLISCVGLQICRLFSDCIVPPTQSCIVCVLTYFHRNTRIPTPLKECLQPDIHLTKLGFVSYVSSVTVMRDCGLLRLVKCDVIILSSVFVIGLVSLV